MDIVKRFATGWTEVPSPAQRRPVHSGLLLSSEKLAVELDGEGHFTLPAVSYDANRRRYLERCGIRVIRFENKSVFRSEEWVLDQIRNEFGWRKKEYLNKTKKDSPPS
jgi:hypothetical protein